MIYVSPVQKVRDRTGFWFVLVSDTSLDELHSFAQIIEAKPVQFVASKRLPRYELPLSYRAACLGAGADVLGSSHIREQCINAFEQFPVPIRLEVIASVQKSLKENAALFQSLAEYDETVHLRDQQPQAVQNTPLTLIASEKPAQQATAPKNKGGRPRKIKP